MQNLKNFFVAIGVFLLSGLFLVLPLSAQPVTPTNDGSSGSTNLICEIFPFLQNINAFNVRSICFGGSLPDKGELANNTLDLLRLGASLIFVGIIVAAVYIVIKAALKYIRSEGDETKIQEAQKAIKSVFVGLIALFIGVIGLVLIIVLFDATGVFSQVPSTETVTDDLGVN